jgi:glycosyltransferase involved in cell wall biosynthesis
MTNERPVPILFVHHRPELGGAPESLAYLIRELDRELFEPHVYCPPGSAAALFRRCGAFVHTGPVAGFTHIWASTYRGVRWLLLGREIARLPRHLRQLSRTFRAADFALVHLNDSPPVAAAWLARRKGLSVVWHLRSALPKSVGRKRSRVLRVAIGRLSSRTVAINEDVAASFALGSVVVPNSVDLSRFHPGDAAAAREALGLPTDLPVVSTFGFLYPSKGFEVFLEAAAILRARGLEATYLLVGGGVRDPRFYTTPGARLLRLVGLARDHEADARRLAQSLGLAALVRFIPFVDDTADHYRASEIVVAASQGPELGRSLIEASASGVPVVASGSATGGGTIVPGVTGLLAYGAMPAEVADLLESLLADPERRRALGRAARRHAEERFDPARNARTIERVYLDVIEGDPLVAVPASEAALRG